MKPIRIIALGLIGAVIARQFQYGGLKQQLEGGQPSLPNQGKGKHQTGADNGLPEYKAAAPTPEKRQPANTPADQQISATKLTNNTP